MMKSIVVLWLFFAFSAVTLVAQNVSGTYLFKENGYYNRFSIRIINQTRLNVEFDGFYQQRDREILTISQGTAAGLARRNGKFVKFIPDDSRNCTAVLLFEKGKLIVTQLGENASCTHNRQIPIAGTFIKVSDKSRFNPEIPLADYFDESVRHEKKRQISLTSTNYGDSFQIIPKGENHQIYSFKGYAGQILELTIKFISANNSVSIRGLHNLELMGKGLTENTWKLRLPEDDEYLVETNGIESDVSGSDYDISIEVDDPDHK